MSEIKLDLRFDLKKAAKAAAIFGALCTVSIGFYGLYNFCKNKALAEAKQLLNDGFPLLASEAVELYKSDIASSLEGCEFLIRAYSAARKADRLHWTVESCLKGNFRSAVVELGVGQMHAANGNLGAALKVFKTIGYARRNPDAYLNASTILVQQNRVKDAGMLLETALLNIPDDIKLRFGAAQLQYSLKNYKQAKTHAEYLKPSVNKLNDDTFNLLVEIFNSAGDTASARQISAARNPAQQTGAQGPQASQGISKHIPRAPSH